MLTKKTKAVFFYNRIHQQKTQVKYFFKQYKKNKNIYMQNISKKYQNKKRIDILFEIYKHKYRKIYNKKILKQDKKKVKQVQSLIKKYLTKQNKIKPTKSITKKFLNKLKNKICFFYIKKGYSLKIIKNNIKKDLNYLKNLKNNINNYKKGIKEKQKKNRKTKQFLTVLTKIKNNKKKILNVKNIKYKIINYIVKTKYKYLYQQQIHLAFKIKQLIKLYRKTLKKNNYFFKYNNKRNHFVNVYYAKCKTKNLIFQKKFLNFDKNINKYLPGFPIKKQNIPVLQNM